MGNVEDKRQVETKHGLYKVYEGNNIVMRPLNDTRGTPMSPAECTLIFLHDNGASPQDYLPKFFCHNNGRLTPYDRYCKIMLMQAPHVVKEHMDKKKKEIVKIDANWAFPGDAL